MHDEVSDRPRLLGRKDDLTTAFERTLGVCPRKPCLKLLPERII
jgi:hypothetical protein